MGVRSYREYEEGHLEKAKERQKRRQEFEIQIGHLKAQLAYESSRDMQRPIEELEKKMRDDEARAVKLDRQTVEAERKLQRVSDWLQALLPCLSASH